ncbi:DUF6377 domain-containing protein [Bacteroides propionicifaciens]|uniref:DUF6377 domain-containing protein n=1 Tax=Bacteroides propionicifaciens TaxID=392838 RepID=UPI00046A1285|nr:DUF6377 domain-containing protein [Bacteroides propionicifaciens]
MKRIILLLFSIFLLTNSISYAMLPDSIAFQLNEALNQKEIYVKEKEKRISSFREVLSLASLTDMQKYELNEKMYQEYSKFKTDSAVHYMLENISLSQKSENDTLLINAQLNLAWLYSTKGKYIEANDILQNIDKKKLTFDLLCSYYRTYNDFYSHYGLSNNDNKYYMESELYRDSLLNILDQNSFEYQLENTKKLLYSYKEDEAIAAFEKLLSQADDTNPERASIAYFLGYTYKRKSNLALQKKYFSISAICDVINSIKDNASFQNLALTCYELGEIDNAYRYIQSAMNDAVFCNVRYRTIESSEFYPIINSAFQAKEASQKETLQFSLLLISLLSLLLIVVMVYIYKQMKKLARIKNQLKKTNKQLTELNDELQMSNIHLEEANHVKEEYIGRFFDQCSEYIEKIENYRKELNRKAKNNQLDDLFRMLKSKAIVEAELMELYAKFDSIFLNIYPDFIKEFNNLLVPEERIYPKQDELLTTELRIYALIRLGITDSNKIASFLRYSLRTVYNYRTKVRNKSAVTRGDFEDYVKKIGLKSTR